VEAPEQGDLNSNHIMLESQGALRKSYAPPTPDLSQTGAGNSQGHLQVSLLVKVDKQWPEPGHDCVLKK
jgi:hypothetical protein